MVRSVAVCPKLSPKPLIFILKPNSPFRSEGCETWDRFSPTSRTNHRSGRRQSNAWDPNPAAICDCSFYQCFPEVWKIFLASSVSFSVFGTRITVFLFGRLPLQCFLAALVTPVLTAGCLKVHVNIGTSKGTAHKPMVDIIPKKPREWKDIICLMVKSGGLMRHTNFW